MVALACDDQCGNHHPDINHTVMMEKHSMRHIAVLFGVIIIAGCEALPKVTYNLVAAPTSPAKNEVASYALQETTIDFTAGKDGSAKATPGRTDHQDNRVIMLDGADYGVESDIGIVKFDNTDIPKEITVKVTDKRKEAIEKVGALAIKVLGSSVVGFSAPSDNIELPLSINLSGKINKDKARDAHSVAMTKERVNLQYGSIPADAIEATSLSGQDKSPYFYYAACRKVDVIFRHNSKRQIVTLKVSDPSYLQRIRLPYDGKITMHTQCGASVSGKLEGEGGSEIALIQALIEQADAVKKALEEDD